MCQTRITIAKSGNQISSAIYLLLVISIFNISCSGQNKKTENTTSRKEKVNDTAASAKKSTNYNYQFLYIDSIPNPEVQISQFVRRIFQDDNENLWFGTNGDGVAR